MGVNLSGRSFLKLLDLTTEEIEYLLKLSKNFKTLRTTPSSPRWRPTVPSPTSRA